MKTLSKNEKIAVAVALVAGLAIFVLLVPGIASSLFIRNDQTTAQTPMNTNNAIDDTTNALKIQDTAVGTGSEAKSGDVVRVKYTGKLMDGTVFDSSEAHGGEPIEFKLGTGLVIKGWDMGIVGMKVGGKRALLIDPSLGYGAQAVGPIPANSTLYFEVELISVNGSK